MTMEDIIAHTGVKRRSGRYPWGSGEHPYQGESDAFRRAHGEKKPKTAKQPKQPKPPKDPVKMERKQLIKKRNLRNMSMQDLETMIARVRKEKELKDLVEADISPGKKMFREVMADVGKKTLAEVSAGTLRYGINYVLQDPDKRQFSTADLARAIYPSLNKQEEKPKQEEKKAKKAGGS